MFSTKRQLPQRVAIFLLSVLAFACGKGDSTPDNTIRVTGIPDENPTELAREFEPMVKLLEAKLGVPVKYIPLTDYGAAVQALAAGKVDFAWLGGFTHVQARNQAKVVPLVMRDIDRKFHSVFIVNSNRGITDVTMLKGKKFAFGSKSSTSGHLMPRHYLLSEHKIDPDKDFDGSPVFSGAHDATVKIVESGKVAAGALNKQVWLRMVAEGKVDSSKVSVLWETPAYVDYVWTARADIDKATRETFSKTFLGLDSANPEDKKILEHMGAKSYVLASPSDFDAIEEVAKAIGMLK
ncbi:MAG: putative selenate ABC transporter substrate-binding protein [Kofleriaceae bacterium]|nr:putative selenate ABC transporter substrate-binding protein [Kofleriaceae bacterium]